jgi:two-component system, LytTR family, sensor kinase
MIRGNASCQLYAAIHILYQAGGGILGIFKGDRFMRQFTKYKLHHLLFWFVYNLIWWVVAEGNLMNVLRAVFTSPYAIKFSFYVFVEALAVNFNIYYLMPRYLEKSRFVAYSLLLLVTILSGALLIIPGYYMSAMLSGKTIASLYGSSCWYTFFGNALPPVTAAMTLAMSIQLTANWIQTKRRQQLLEKEKLETELMFLKNQFNPHFLFNTINSIFFLIHKTPSLASASLAKFSDLLRYQLYECNDVQIPLSKEMAYIENFIELEKLRQNSNVEIRVHLEEQPVGHLDIAPFILMTFVENAFKHVSRDGDKHNWIHISLQLRNRQLEFAVANSTGDDPVIAIGEHGGIAGHGGIGEPGGIGLKNVKRRLDLIYPGQYELDIRQEADRYDVKLRMKLLETHKQLVS